MAELVGDSTHWLRDAFRHGARMVRAGDDLVPRLLWFADLSAMLSLEPLASLVPDVVDLKQVRQSRRRLRIATADWVTGRLELHDGSGLNGQAGYDRIVAAAARPGIFACVEIDGTPQVDAAPFAASHLSAAIEAGASELHVPVFLGTRAENDRPSSTIDALDRMLAESQLARLQREVTELRAHSPRPLAIHVYRGRLGPAQSHGFLDVRRERVQSLIDHGRQAVSRHDCRESGCLVPADAPRP
jgi:predicted acylesterase/phospholipase RssA